MRELGHEGALLSQAGAGSLGAGRDWCWFWCQIHSALLRGAFPWFLCMQDIVVVFTEWFCNYLHCKNLNGLSKCEIVRFVPKGMSMQFEPSSLRVFSSGCFSPYVLLISEEELLDLFK